MRGEGPSRKKHRAGRRPSAHREEARRDHQTIALRVAFGAALVAPALAVNYDEVVDGDLSNDRFNPTPFTLQVGLNTIRMNVVDSNDFDTGDIDYFSITIPVGLQLDSIFLLESSVPHGAFDSIAFVGVAAGPIFPIDPMFIDPEPLLGFVLTAPELVGTDITADLGLSAPVAGERVYSFWVQQTGFDLTTVALDFNVSVIPSPASAPLLALGALALRRRR